MKIVLEGPDYCGKSSVAAILAERLNFNLRSKITRVPDTEVVLTNAEEFFNPIDTVMDRCYWLTNLIYEPITKSKASVFTSRLHFIISMLECTNSYVFYLKISAEELARRASRGDELWDFDTIRKLHASYESKMPELIQLSPRIIGIECPDNCSPESIAQTIIEVLNEEKRGN